MSSRCGHDSEKTFVRSIAIRRSSAPRRCLPALPSQVLHVANTLVGSFSAPAGGLLAFPSVLSKISTTSTILDAPTGRAAPPFRLVFVYAAIAAGLRGGASSRRNWAPPAPRSRSRRGAPPPADEDSGQHWPFFLLSMRCSAPPRWRRARPLASFSSSPTPPLLACQPPFPLSLPLCLIPPRPARPPLHVSSARSPQVEPNDRRLDAAGRSALLWSTSPSSISRAAGQRRLHTRRHVGRHGTARAAAPSPHQSCDHCQGSLVPGLWPLVSFPHDSQDWHF